MKKYRVAVIGRTGKGNYGHGIDTVWLQISEAEIVGVADDDKAGLAAGVKRLGAKQGFADYRQMLDETKPEIVSICQRWLDQHRDMAVACAERGIHVYMEKPFCRTPAEADEIIAACEKTHTRLAIAHQTHWSPKIPVLQQLIADGKLGRILEFRGRGKEDSRGGGEDTWVLGSHIMDLIRLFGGQPTSCTAWVTAGGKPIRGSDVVEGPEGIGPLAGDAVRAMYAMPDGSTAYFSSYRNTASKVSRFGLQIFGTGGVLEIITGHLSPAKYLSDPSWGSGRSSASWEDVSTAGVGKPEPIKDEGLPGGNVLAVRDLLQAIEEHRQPKCSMYEGRGTVEMITAIFASQCAGVSVALPLVERDNPLKKLA